VGLLLWAANARLLPESLPASERQRFSLQNLLAGYRVLGTDLRFLALVLAAGVPFNGMFLYVVSAPTFLGELLGWRPDQFFLFFCLTIMGIMGGAWLSGRLAGRISLHRQIRYGFLLMLLMGELNVALNVWSAPQGIWAVLPIPLFAMGWAMVTPAVTMMVLDLVPQRRGMASSLQSCLASAFNGLVAGLIAPWVMHSQLALALASMGLMMSGAGVWWWIRPRLNH
jgi:DHA1 family bicyclomycin/chloramphenicol resistance-like MFS transporter